MAIDDAPPATEPVPAVEPAPEAVAEDPEAHRGSLLRNRSWQAFWVSETLAAVAEQSADIAYPLLVLATTGSASYAGAVGSAQLLATGLLSIVGGTLADRFDRRRLLVLCNTVRAVLLGAFCWMIAVGTVPIAVTFAVALVSAACFGISMPTQMALIKQLVRPSQLTEATAQNQIRWFGAITAGPPVGGWLFGVARALPFVGAAVAFLVSNLLLMLVKVPAAQKPATGTAGRGTMEGFRFLFRHPVLRPLMISITLSNMAFNTTGIFLAVIATAKERGASDGFTGVTLALAGAGGLLGSLVAGEVIKRTPPPLVFIVGYGIGPIAALLLAVVPGVVPLGVIVACVFVRGPIISALFLTYAAKLVPDDIQGRVLGAIVFTSMIASPIGVLAVGAIFDTGGSFWVFVAVAVTAALGTLPTLTRGVRTLRPLDEITS
ncbi:MFS transporter [Kitasatospora sp. NPDC048296]|uniref:MFS transporter n=1 Tax=Kitasatospora sp. NPDC048296 TaxID=3364048 RepID=UPI0037174FBA